MINSSSLEDQSAPIEATEPSSPLTESVADTVARVVDGLRQSLGEGCSSSTSSDSLSSVISANNTGIVQQLSHAKAVLVLWIDFVGCHYFFKKLF